MTSSPIVFDRKGLDGEGRKRLLNGAEMDYRTADCREHPLRVFYSQPPFSKAGIQI
jgi:hypothetical protein